MIETIRRLVCGFCKSGEAEPQPHPFTILRHRSGQDIKQILRKQYPNATIRMRDADYSTPRLQDFNKWILEDTVSERQYFENHFDCDDFAHAIQCKIFKIGHALKTTLTVGYCEGHAPSGEYHAFNIVVTSDDNVHIIEPQTDHVSLADDSLYTPDFIQL